MAAPTVFHGDGAEQDALLTALERNCGCSVNGAGVRTVTCSAHRMLLEDQRALDGLLAYRHLSDRLKAEEGLPPEGGNDGTA